MSDIILPVTDKSGRPKLSYSQYNLWREKKGFNTGLLGRWEYIRKYLLRESYPQNAYGSFGQDVECYVRKQGCEERFSDEEKKTLDQVEPLGIYEYKVEVDFGDFVLEGYIDDMTEDHSIYRDYKTASENSKEKLYKDDYEQLDIYALYSLRENGFIPIIELCIIERMGNAYAGGREALKVGENIWWHRKKIDKEGLETLDKKIRQTAEEISEYYKVFQKVNR